MSAAILTAGGSPVPDDLMPAWCEMWADGDKRLRAAEIALNVLGAEMPVEPGTLWERVREGRRDRRLTSPIR